MLAVFRYLLIVQNLLANFLDLYADHFYMIPESYGHRDGIAIVEKNRFRLKKHGMLHFISNQNLQLERILVHHHYDMIH